MVVNTQKSMIQRLGSNIVEDMLDYVLSFNKIGSPDAFATDGTPCYMIWRP